MAITMGYWDCPSCGRKKIDGPRKDCPECGAPRNENVEFYTSDDAPEVKDPELVARAKAGADWICQFCGADNPAKEELCSGCGASKDGTKKREQKLILDNPPPAKPKSGGGKKILYAVLGGLALLVFGVWFLFVRSSPMTMSVQRIVWTKTLLTERLTTVVEEAWADSVPPGARVVSETTRQKTERVQNGTERVKVGKRDLGNGMFEDVYEDRPRWVERQVDAKWARYEIERWIDGQRLQNRAEGGAEPDEPRFTPTRTERVRNRDEEVAIALQNDAGKAYSYDLEIDGDASKREKARRLKLGGKYVAMVNTVGGITKLEIP